MGQRHTTFRFSSGLLARSAVGLVAGLALASAAGAQDASVTPTLAMTLAPATGGATLTVTSSAFKNDETLPSRYTQYGRNESPPLHWSRGPDGTQSYVVLVEDSGVHRAEPIFHWVLYNVPGKVTHLAAHLPTTPELKMPAGAMNGLNIRKTSGYMGPRPPKGQTHPYHFEVFALDETLSLSPDMATRDAVVDAMKGHVLAEGEIIGNVSGPAQ